MKLNKIISILVIFIGIIALKAIPSYAGSIGISTSTKTIEPGKTFNVTVSANNAMGSVSVTGSNCKVSTSSVWLDDKNTSETITVTAGNEGKATITVKTSDISDATTAEEFSSSKSVSVDIKKKEQPTPTPVPKATATPKKEPTQAPKENSDNNKPSEKSQPTATPVPKNEEKEEEKKSDDATLKNFGILPKEYDFSGFQSSKTDYNVTVDNSAEEINIYAYASNSKASVVGAGTKKLEIGVNEFVIEVTAEDGTTKKQYNLTVTREEEKKEDKMALGIYKLSLYGITEDDKEEELELNKEFERDRLEYECDVKEEIKKVVVKAEAYDYTNSIKIEGADSELQNGENLIKVSVNDDKETITYKIKVNKGNNNSEVKEVEKASTEEQNPTINTKGNNLIGMIVLIFVIILILGAIITLVIMKFKKDDDDEA